MGEVGGKERRQRMRRVENGGAGKGKGDRWSKGKRGRKDGKEKEEESVGGWEKGAEHPKEREGGE